MIRQPFAFLESALSSRSGSRTVSKASAERGNQAERTGGTYDTGLEVKGRRRRSSVSNGIWQTEASVEEGGTLSLPADPDARGGSKDVGSGSETQGDPGSTSPM